MYGYPILDPVGALIVAGIIVKIGVDMTMRSCYHLLDRLTPQQTEHVGTLEEALRSIPGAHTQLPEPFESRDTSFQALMAVLSCAPGHTTGTWPCTW